MKTIRALICSIFVFITIFAPCFIKAARDEDPRNSIRISEISLDVGKMSSMTTFMFVEIFTPLKNVPVNSVTIVIYGASHENVLHTCPCDKAVFNELGYAQCDCGGNVLFATQEFVGVVGLHNADQINFPAGADASICSQINLIDAVLWQSYGSSILPNPLKPYFAQGQVYHYQQPATPAAYSINRCYGDPLTNQRWQASFSWNETATPNGPNLCLPPVVIVNEINFNKAFIELWTSPELPLDNVTIAFVQDVNSSPSIINAYSLLNQRTESSSFFTMGKVGSDFMIPGWTMPTTGSVAVVAYFDIILQSNALAPSINILSSIVYGANNGPTSPVLSIFGGTTYAYDATGKCSLSVCNGNVLDIQLAPPSFDSQNDCSVQCLP